MHLIHQALHPVAKRFVSGSSTPSSVNNHSR